jgi:hypothetical protein
LGDVVYTFEITEDKELDTLHKIAVLGNPPTECNCCGVDDASMFKMISNKDKDANTYVNVKCKNCGADAKLGLYKSGGFFWHDFKKYERQSNG